MEQHAATDVGLRPRGDSAIGIRATAGAEAGDGAIEERAEFLWRISAALELSKEGDKLQFPVGWVRAEGKDSMEHAMDDTSKEARGMTGVRRDVQMVVGRLLIKRRVDPITSDGDGEILSLIHI